ncbi:uncharacterized protein LOC134811447 isoform X2 [Bolinopsis microptera]|uniref:uncharacterized protein LOC134811447 isoform X2 n=1 Tax=Bolinopsis microptera TaxID=2820187 RepID=UPI0030798235
MMKFSILLLVMFAVMEVSCGKLVERDLEADEMDDNIEAIYYKLSDVSENGPVKRAASCSERAQKRCNRNGMNCNVWGGGFSCVW